MMTMTTTRLLDPLKPMWDKSIENLVRSGMSEVEAERRVKAHWDSGDIGKEIVFLASYLVNNERDLRGISVACERLIN